MILATSVAILIALIVGFFELDRMRTERLFPGIADYKAKQKERDAESPTMQPKTATTMGSVIK